MYNPPYGPARGVFVPRSDVPYLLIQAPLCDPTAPYHSISYLVGATKAHGFTDVECIDANVESLNYLAREEHVATLLEYCRGIIAGLEAKPRLTRFEQLQYRFALRAIGMRPSMVEEAISIFQESEKFYNYPLYREAVAIVNRWMDALSVKGFPGQFEDFALSQRGIINLSSVADLASRRIIATVAAPFAEYFTGPFLDELRKREWMLIGISVSYTSQLPIAAWLSSLIRAQMPHTLICVGGTEISDIVKYSKSPADIWRIFSTCDAIVVGEGESALIELLETARSGLPLPTGKAGIITRDALRLLGQQRVKYEDIAHLPPPDYGVWKWDHYWSPEPTLLYSPTRGCYWNRCTFCDYGLNTDGPTSPSRERSVATVVEDLRRISRLAKTVYFAVDAISPIYLKALAAALIEDGIDIRWAAELRLEPLMRKDLGTLLAEAGCVCISFGYESGSQRVLNLIDKGVKLEIVPHILERLASENIGAQMMGFIGFPGETLEEAKETYEFLIRHSELWSLAGIGEFELTPGSIVAKQPDRFGISSMDRYPGDDIARTLSWSTGPDAAPKHAGHMEAEIARLRGAIHSITHSRPFVGGIDAAHSILYFARYGRDLLPPDYADAMTEPNELILSAEYCTPFDNPDRFIDGNRLVLQRMQFCENNEEINSDRMLRWLMQYDEIESTPRVAGSCRPIEIFPSGVYREKSAHAQSRDDDSNEAYEAMKWIFMRGSGLA